MMKLLIATTNAGKLRDFTLAAGEVNIEAMPGLAVITAPEEDQATFEGNALLKAVYYSQFALGEIIVADDSGLEVDALDGAPGVRSARYAEDAGYLVGSGLPVDERNNRCLIAALEGVPVGRRSARFRCVLAAARDGEVLAVATGSVEGVILTQARGGGGFGYDPYFAPQGSAESMAKLASEARLRLSHRGRALRHLLAKLKGVAEEFTR